MRWGMVWLLSDKFEEEEAEVLLLFGSSFQADSNLLDRK